MYDESITFVGMDVHKKMVQVALLAPGHREPVEWQEPNESAAVQRLARRLVRESGGDLLACYEAGPTGYALQRQLRAAGVPCQVIAPSLTPVKPGERIKTDRRDARKLAELLRADLLTEVHPPSESEEALRDLCRCREDAREDLTRAHHRMSKFLLRRHCLFTGTKRAWGTRHLAWLHTLHFDDPASQATFDCYLIALDQLEERLRHLDDELAARGSEEPYREPVAWLRCFRGIDTVTAVSLVAELHDFRRFPTPRSLMAFLGLVPREHSSGETKQRGSITRAGNSHARRLLVEAAWHHRHRPAISLPLRRRREGQPARIIALADRAHDRLHRRFARLTLRGKPTQKAVVAVARELAGFLWVILHPEGIQAQRRTHQEGV
ncbi:MAG: IS110 family transposase [Candidatus Latescibacterota bacterium]|nr:MAG: IS110 family transposase [Candidatus Latescibacterota bacterium]